MSGNAFKRRRPPNKALVVESSSDDEPPRPAPARHSAAAPPGAASPPAHASRGPMKVAMELLLGGAAQGGLPPPQTGKANGKRPAAPRRKKLPAAAPSAAAAAPPAAAPAAPAAAPSGELWVDKHAPRVEADLVVHKKKADEVRAWLAHQRSVAGRAASAAGVSRVLLVTGPPGCGKSATVAVLAAAAGFEVSEWRTPTPTLWDEVQYQREGGGQYQRGQDRPQYHSKMDAFDEFVLRAKLPALALAPPPPPPPPPPDESGAAAGAAPAAAPPAAATLRPRLVVLDDLPHAAGPDQRRRLAAALRDLCSTARFPVVVCATQASGRAQQERGGAGAGAPAAPSGLPKDLSTVLEVARAATIAFNPLTALGVAKALQAALLKEQRALPAATVTAIAERADGDLHNALSTLQFVCTGAAPAAAPPPAAPRRKRGRAAAGAGSAADGGGGDGGGGGEMAAHMQRDASLSLFHGLGKLLYNKRRPLAPPPPAPGAPAPGGAPASAPQPAAWTLRDTMDNFDPEAVLAGAGLAAGSVAAFLHENLPNFVDDGAVGDLAGCLDYLSAADVLAGGVRWGGGEGLLVEDDMPSGPLGDAAAASVAARGVCFCNAHPAPRRWQPLVAPALFHVQRGVAANRAELAAAAGAGRVVHGGSGGLDSAARVAAEILPHLRRIGPARPADASLLMQQPARWTRYWGGRLHEARLHGGAGRGGEGLEAAADQDWIEEC
jgi:cell cycle checkpoint protein